MLGMVRGLVKDNILIPSFACQKLVLVPSRTMRVRPARRGPQSVEQTADQLSHVIGQNSVVFETPSVKGHIDLRGQAHFDKATRWRIPTPDVQISPKIAGLSGAPGLGRQTTRPATKADIRRARALAKRRGQL